MRDYDKNPYSPCEQRVAKFFMEVVGIGGGDDPIGFIIASHAALAAERQELKGLLAFEQRTVNEMIMNIALGAGGEIS